MKKLHYILFALILFMAFTTGVEAESRCVYNYNDVNIVLKTTDDDNVLDSIEGGNYVMNYKIASGNKITLKNGNCPNVTFFNRELVIGARRFIYQSKIKCKEANPTYDELCDTVSGTLDNSEVSDEGLTQENPQFDLISSSANECVYSYDNITITAKKDGDSIKWSGKNENNEHTKFSFGSKDKVEEELLNSGNLTCPKFLYAKVIPDVRATQINFIGIGTDADPDYSTDIEETHENSWKRPDSISDESWNKPIGCSDIFSEEPGSVGSILRTILGYIRVIGPILVVILSAIDFIKAIFGFDEKAMTNAYHKLIIRLIAAIALFLIPTLIDVLLNFINATTCTDYFK